MRPEDSSNAEKAYQKILRLATAREQSSSAVRNRLLQDGYTAEAVDEALDRALRNRVIDDGRFADFFVRAKLSSGKGASSIERELCELGIDPLDVDALQEHLNAGENVEVERALDLLRLKPPRSKNPQEAAFRKLVQKGYSKGVAAAASRAWSEGLSR